jgi:hypothetical protein
VAQKNSKGFLIRPGVTTLAKMVATARTSATALTWEKVAHLFSGQPLTVRPLVTDCVT